jgi:hypothetical protein
MTTTSGAIKASDLASEIEKLFSTSMRPEVIITAETPLIDVAKAVVGVSDAITAWKERLVECAKSENERRQAFIKSDYTAFLDALGVAPSSIVVATVLSVPKFPGWKVCHATSHLRVRGKFWMRAKAICHNCFATCRLHDMYGLKRELCMKCYGVIPDPPKFPGWETDPEESNIKGELYVKGTIYTAFSVCIFCLTRKINYGMYMEVADTCFCRCEKCMNCVLSPFDPTVNFDPTVHKAIPAPPKFPGWSKFDQRCYVGGRIRPTTTSICARCLKRSTRDDTCFMPNGVSVCKEECRESSLFDMTDEKALIIATLKSHAVPASN